MATPGAQMLGRCRFHYALVPYAERWAAVTQAHSFTAPPLAVWVPAEIGPQSLVCPWLAVEPAGFLITAIKPAENGTGRIVRGFNATEEPLKVTLRPAVPASLNCL